MEVPSLKDYFIRLVSNLALTNPASIKPAATLDIGTRWTGDIAVDSDRLITTGQNESIQVWDKQELTLVHSLVGHPNDDGVNFAIVGDRLISYATCGLGAQIKIWDLQRGVLLNTTNTHRYYVMDETCLVQSSYEWDKETNRTEQQTKIWNLHDGTFRCALGSKAFGYSSPESLSSIPVLSGDHVITGQRNGSVDVWSKHDGSHVINLAPIQEDHKQSITFLLADGDRVIWANEHGEVRASQKLDNSIIQTFEYQRSGVKDTGFLTVTDDLLIGRFKTEKKYFINVWHKESGAFLYSLDCNYTGLAIDGNRLAVHAPEQGTIVILDKRYGSHLLSIGDENASYLKLRMTGNLLIGGSHKTNIHIWNLENGALLSTLQGCTPFILDGSRLITSSLENPSKVLIYDLPTLP